MKRRECELAIYYSEYDFLGFLYKYSLSYCRLMYWDSVAKLVAPGGILVSSASYIIAEDCLILCGHNYN